MKRLLPLIFVLCALTSSICLSQNKYVEMSDSSFAVNDIVKLRNPIRFFICGDSFLKGIDENSHISLDELAVFLNSNKNLQVEIGVHTDSRGSSEANKRISTQRANSIRALLIEKGVDSLQMVAYGYEESVPMKIYVVDGEYTIEPPTSQNYELVTLSESYINQFKKINQHLFTMLHQKNGRTEIKFVAIDAGEQ